MTHPAYIYESLRTPRGKGKKDGALYEVKPVRLLADLLAELRHRCPFNTARLDDVIMGCVTPVGEQGMNIAKTAIQLADYQAHIPGFQLNRFCASGLEAVNIAAQKIASGWEHMIIAGGVESMSRIPIGSDGGAWALDPETAFKSHFVPQGISADLIATLDGFQRHDLDAYALRSHRKAAQAQAQGRFDRSVVPVRDEAGLTILDHDEAIRPDTDQTALANLKPSFAIMGEMGFDAVALGQYSHLTQINHFHTAGNSSAIVDGAAAMIIGDEAFGVDHNLTPRARILAGAVIGTEPTIMLTGPAPAAKLALQRAHLTPDDIDLFEINEAFAAVVLRFMRELHIAEEKINVCGGAIAMGHPLGATGAMILGTLLDELEARKLRRGVAALCVGGGMGVATVIERL